MDGGSKLLVRTQSQLARAVLVKTHQLENEPEMKPQLEKITYWFLDKIRIEVGEISKDTEKEGLIHSESLAEIVGVVCRVFIEVVGHQFFVVFNVAPFLFRLPLFYFYFLDCLNRQI